MEIAVLENTVNNLLTSRRWFDVSRGELLSVRGNVDNPAGFFVPGNNGGQLLAIPIPWAVDGAGVAYPANTVLALAGSPAQGFVNFFELVSSAGVLNVDYEHDISQGETGLRGFVGGLIFIQGATKDTVGTIKIIQHDNFNSSAASPTTLHTITVDGNNGATQFLSIPDIYIPDSLVRLTRYITFETSWVGTHPKLITVVQRPWGPGSGWILPTEIPSGYTEIVDLGAPNRTYDSGVQPRGLFTGPVFALGELGLLAKPWARSDSSQGFKDTTGINRRRFALASTQVVYRPEFLEFTLNDSSPAVYVARSKPCAFVGNAIKEMSWWPFARGQVVDTGTLGTAFSRGTTSTAISHSTESAWQILSVGPGWRNLRVWMQLFEEVGATITAADLQFRVDGGAATTVDVVGLSGDGVTGDFVDYSTLIVGAQMNSVLEIRARITVYFPVSASSQRGEFALIVSASPRCDIPAPWHFPGRGCDDSPPAYKDSSLSDPTPLGGVRHVAASLVLSAWTVAETFPDEIQTRIISFICPTTGFWRVEPPAGDVGITLGELESRLNVVGAAIGRAGKRFFGRYTTSYLPGLNGDWELIAVTPSRTAIPQAGLEILSGHLTRKMFFGTVALPSAGTYKIWANSSLINYGPVSVRLLASKTDEFCADPCEIDIRYETCNVGDFPGFISASTPPLSLIFAQIYLITGTPTGIWSGKSGQLAAWNKIEWRYFSLADLPVPSSAIIDDVFSIWDGTSWTAASATNIIQSTVTVTAATTYYVRATSCDDENVTQFPNQPTDITIGWQAV